MISLDGFRLHEYSRMSPLLSITRFGLHINFGFIAKFYTKLFSLVSQGCRGFEYTTITSPTKDVTSMDI